MISLLALLLSLSAIYSVMSFAVSRRTREIGIRIALGSSVQAITLTIFRQPMKQVAWGVVLGGVLVALLSAAATGDLPIWQQGAAILAYTLVMTVVYALRVSCRRVERWRCSRRKRCGLTGSDSDAVGLSSHSRNFVRAACTDS